MDKITLGELFREIDDVIEPSELNYSAMTDEELNFLLDLDKEGKLDDESYSLLSQIEKKKLTWILNKYSQKDPENYNEMQNPFNDGES